MSPRLDPRTALYLERHHGRCVCYQGSRQVRAERTLKSAAEFAARLPPITPSALLLLRKVALHPERLQRVYSGSYLQAAVWRSTAVGSDERTDMEDATADVMELRIRGLVVTGRLTKAGANALG